MRQVEFVTVEVFTHTRFDGNQLAVFLNAEGLDDAEMQSLAAEMNLSETTFVLPPDDSANSARVRIFNRTAEMPFAGHPNVGTGFVLASRHPELSDVLRFEELAGLVEVRVVRGSSGEPAGAEFDAPQPLRLLGELPIDDVVACIGLPPSDLLATTHPPLRATLGVEFLLVEVAVDALSRAGPDLPSFRRAAQRTGLDGRLSIFLYAQEDAGICARMFAPMSGTWEDPATGSASATLGALLLLRSDEVEARFSRDPRDRDGTTQPPRRHCILDARRDPCERGRRVCTGAERNGGALTLARALGGSEREDMDGHR